MGTVQSFKTVEIPRMVRGKQGAWDPIKCLDWAKRFIAFLQNVVTPVQAIKDGKDGQVPVWRVKFNPGTGVSVSLLDGAGVDEVSAGEERVGFLPKWYIDELELNAPPPELPVEDSEPHDSVLPSGWQI